MKPERSTLVRVMKEREERRELEALESRLVLGGPGPDMVRMKQLQLNKRRREERATKERERRAEEREQKADGREQRAEAREIRGEQREKRMLKLTAISTAAAVTGAVAAIAARVVAFAGV
jgi:hypothetical protein